MSELNGLSLNDLALAQFACAHAMNWTKAQGRSKYWKAEFEKFKALNKTLSDLQDAVCTEDVPDHLCAKPVLTISDKMAKRIRSVAAKDKAQRLSP